MFNCYYRFTLLPMAMTTTITKPKVKPHAARDVRLLDLDQITRRINALMDYLFGKQRDNESELIPIPFIGKFICLIH